MTKERMKEIKKLVAPVTKPCRHLGDVYERSSYGWETRFCESEDECEYEGRLYGVVVCERCPDEYEEAIIDLLELVGDVPRKEEPT